MEAASKQLLVAAADGDIAALEAALAAGADIEAAEEYGDTALNRAAANGHGAIVARLIAAGANLENLGGADMTPLMNAATAGHLPSVRTLIAAGAKVTDDLLGSVSMKVSILEENAEIGMVRPEAVGAWRGFLNELLAARTAQDMD
jgi:ankyrin repeat protein